MLYWTIKSLISEKVGVIAAGIGVMLALVLALYLDAVFRGEARQIVAFIERMPGEVWVLQDGVENLHMSSSSLSDDTIAEVRQVPGVRSVLPIVYGSATYGEKGRERVSYVVGIPSDVAIRDRLREATGWPMPEGESFVLPEQIGKDLELKIGDTIRVGKRRHSISAFSEGAFSMANPLMFMDESHARRVTDVLNGASLLLVQPEPGVSPFELVRRINAASTHVRAVTREQLRQNDYVLALQMGGALLAMFAIIATVVSTLIVAFSAYAFVAARTGELAVAKALGAPRHQLLGSALLQTFVVALLGCVLAIGIIGPIGAALSRYVPQVAVDFSYITALRLSALVVVVAVVSALIPALYVAKVDPALVFKG
jgi:putative ABC transport system permease protein